MKPLTCEQIEKLFSQIFGNEPIDELLRKQFDDHLAQCERCRNSFKEWQDMENSIMRTLQGQKDRHIPTTKLAQFADNACDSEFEKLLIEDHLTHCAECRATYEDILLLNQSAEQFHFRLPLSWKIRKKIKGLASALASYKLSSSRSLIRKFAYGTIWVAVLVLLTIFSVKFLHRQPNPVQSNKFAATVKSDTSKNILPKKSPQIQITAKSGAEAPPSNKASIKEKIKQLYADDFKPLPAMEGLLAYNARGEGIKIISPKSGQNYRGKIFFRWEYPEKKRFYLKIYSNKGIEVFSCAIDTTNFLFSKKLNPGLYYWKLETEDELLYLDKFFVGRE